MKVRLFCCTHDIQSKSSEVFEFSDDITDEELEKAAEEYFWNSKEPEWWFEKLPENDESKIGEA